MSGDANGEERAERYRRQRELENLVTSALVEAMTEPRSETEIYRLLKKLLEIHEEDFRLSRDQALQIFAARGQSKAAADLALALAQKGFVAGEDVTQLLHWGDLSALHLIRLALENSNLYLSPDEAHSYIGTAVNEGMVYAAVNNRLKGGFGLIPRLSSHQVASWMELRTELACRAVEYLGERIGDDPKQGVRGFFVENAKDADDGVSYMIYSAAKNNGETVCLVEASKVTARQLFVGPYTRSLVSDLTAGNPQALAWMHDHPLTSLGQSAGRN